MFARDQISVQERLCGHLSAHTEHQILYFFSEFRNYPDAYLSKTTNPRLTHAARVDI